MIFLIVQTEGKSTDTSAHLNLIGVDICETMMAYSLGRHTLLSADDELVLS
jgi:hypothetical protein